MRIDLLEIVYACAGVLLVIFAMMTYRARPRTGRWISGTFWLLLGLTFIFGKHVPPAVVGGIVIALVVLDGTGRVGRATVESVPRGEQVDHANHLRGRVFWPVLTIPL